MTIGFVNQKTRWLILCYLVVVLYSGLFGALEMIGALEKNHLLDLSNIIFLCCFWLDSWAIRQKKKEQRMVVLGSKLIRKTTSEAFGRALGWCPLDRRISG
jgi:hypothetical protein